MRLLIFSDIHGDKAALERLMQVEADYYFAAGDLVNWGRGLGDVGPIMAPRAERLYLIPGNHESAADISNFAGQFGFHDFHGQSMQLGRWTVGGLGYSNITPFKTPGEYTEPQLQEHLEKFTGLAPPLVMVCHCPPKNSRLDRAGEGQHFGSPSVREFIERVQPAHFFCGHIHEAAGQTEQLGRTVGMNVGKAGYLLQLD